MFSMGYLKSIKGMQIKKVENPCSKLLLTVLVCFVVGVAGAWRGVSDRVRDQVHGDVCQSLHQCGRIIFQPCKRHQSKNGEKDCKFVIVT